MKNILDEIRPQNVVVIPREKRQGGRKDEGVFCYSGLRGFKNRMQRTTDIMELLVAEIIMGNGVEEEQKKEQAQNPIMEQPVLFHKAKL